MRSRLQHKKRRQSKQRKMIRRGGRPIVDNKFWQVSYEVLCHDSHPISASDLFSMVNTGLYQMATGHGDPPILGVENIVISQLFKREREAYKVQLNVEFPEEMDSSEINRWKESYLAGIHERELFKNGSFVPTETTFHFEPISQAEYPDLIAPSSHARDV